MAHVQSPVRVGRAVMEREDLSVVLQAQLQVDAVLIPERLQFWLALDRIGPHAKAGLQQVERVRRRDVGPQRLASPCSQGP